MADEWIEAAGIAAPHAPGVGALLISIAAFFRFGRGLGRAEAKAKQQDKDIAEVQGRLVLSEAWLQGLALKIAALPTREEVREMHRELREDIRAR